MEDQGADRPDVDQDEGWLPEPDQERFSDGTGADRAVLPEHGSELHRALAAATDDIEEVEDRLGVLFERTPRSTASAVEGLRDRTAQDDGDDGDWFSDEDVPQSLSLRGAADDVDEESLDIDVDALLKSREERVESPHEGGPETGDDDLILTDIDEEPEEFEDVEDVHDETGDSGDDELSDLDAALASEAPEEL